VAGFVIYAHDSSWQVIVALLAMQASFMISYASAKAEALAVDIPRGLMRRHERAAVLTLASGLTPLLGPALHARWDALPATGPFVIGLGLVALIGGVAGVVRFVWIRAALRA
ncbi:MAG TPA: hypothetical protein VFQ65_08830, partial [Kofleriaceae bacterium]|nr:hypothetical protein [Kofleriaceae bacterium]